MGLFLKLPLASFTLFKDSDSTFQGLKQIVFLHHLQNEGLSVLELIRYWKIPIKCLDSDNGGGEESSMQNTISEIKWPSPGKSGIVVFYTSFIWGKWGTC